MRNRLGRWVGLVGVILLICGAALLLAAFADASGLRARWQAEADRAAAARIEAAAARERQWPLITASLADTAMATVYAAWDRVAFFALLVYVLWRDRRRDHERGRDVR